jgi:hypothetical protein
VNDKQSAPLTAQEIAVFGADATRDKDGHIIERGKGGPLQQTPQHKAALERAAGRRPT